MIRREIKPRQIVMRGNKVWVVRVPVDLRGDDPATRFFGDDKKAADGYAKQLRDARVSLGGEFLRLTSLEQGAMIQCLREVGVNGLLDAVSEYRAKAKISEILLTDLRNACIESKRAANMRHNSLATLSCTLKSFCAWHAGKQAKCITIEDVEKWLNHNGWEPKTRLNYLKNVETMYKFGARYGLSNPCENVERPKVDRKSKPFLTPPQAYKLLKTCAEIPFKLGSGKKSRFVPDIEMLGYIAPVLFNGIRPHEAARIKPENVRWNGGRAVIDLSGKQTKLRLRRLVAINDTCLCWMTLPVPGEFGPTNIHIATKNLTKRMRRIIAASGLEWGHDILRHSFCSYAAQKFGSKEAAKLSNHSEDVLHRDYREVVSDSDANDFWDLRL